MKNLKSKILLFAAVMLLSCLGIVSTYAILKSETGSVLNQFFAANIYTLKYDLNAGDDETTPSTILSQIHIGATKETTYEFTISETEISRTGYVFLGWADTADAENVMYLPGEKIEVTSQQKTKILYAVWEANLKFVLKYDLNYDGAPEMDSFSQEFIADGMKESHTFNTKDIPNDVVNEGYIFLGWAESLSATEAQYEVGNPVSVVYDESTGKAEKTLYAVWTEDTSYIEYSIVFDNNLPTDVIDGAATEVPQLSKKVQSNEHTFRLTSMYSPKVNDFDETGLVFAGWSTSEDGHAEYIPGDETCNAVTLNVEEGKNTASTTLFAVWEREYYIVYKSTVKSPEAQKYVISTNQLAEDDNPMVYSSREKEVVVINGYEETGYYYKRPGFVLIGFSEEENGNTPVENELLTTPGRNHAKVLYAIWEKGSYAIIYDANGGTGAPDAQVEEEVTDSSFTFTIQSSDALKPHSGAYDAEFLGWAYDADALKPDFEYDSANKSFTPSTLTLKEEKPSVTLHAVWKYHYVLSFDKGYGDEGYGVPDLLECYTTSKTHEFDMPTATAEQTPFRTGYTFMGYWSDELDRRNEEDRYYDGSYGSDHTTSIELTSTETHVTLYARFNPLAPFILKFDANGGSNPPNAITKPYTEDWQCLFSMPAEQPTKSNNTFVGWSDNENADYTWLSSNDPEKQIYGGYSSNNTYVMNGDKSLESTLYAVWAPDHYVRVYVDYNGGTAWYQTSYSYETSDDGCTDETAYAWNAPTTVTTPGTSWGKKITFDEYWNSIDNVFEVATVGGVAGSYNSTSGKLYIASKDGCELRGFSQNVNAETPEYTTDNGKLIVTPSGQTPYAGGSSASNGTSFRSSGYYMIKNVAVDLDTAECEKGTYTGGGNYYSITLNALWKSTVDYYKIAVVDPDNGNKVTVLDTKSVEISENEEKVCTFDANTVWSTFRKTGWICDFAYTPNATVPDLTVSSTWVAHSNKKTSNVDKPEKVNPYQKWSIDSDIYIKINPDGQDTPYELTKVYDSNLLADVYTLTLYPVWQKGQIFTLNINSPSSSGGTMYRRYYAWALAGERWNNYTTYSKDSVSVTARAEDPSFEFQPGEAGEFYGPRSNVEDSKFTSIFRGYSYTSGGRGNVDFTTSYRETEHTYAASLSGDVYTGKQRWDTINEKVTIYQSNTGEKNSEGIPVSTLNLYAVWEPYKTYKVSFDANGGTEHESYSDLVVYQQSSTVPIEERNYPFESKSANAIYVPTRENYELLGFSYSPTAKEPDFGLIKSGEKYYLDKPVVVSDLDEGQSNRTVNVSTSGDPHVTTLTLYAVWEKKQVYKVILDYNEGIYTDNGNVKHSSEEHKVIVDASKEYADMSIKSYSPTLSGYKLLGYSYEKITAGTATAEQLENIPFPLDENGQISVHVVKNDPDEMHESVTESIEGVEVTTLKLYAVWSQNATYYRIHMVSTLGTEKTGDISRTDTAGTEEYKYPVNTLVSNYLSLLGYRLAGLSYEDDGTIDEDIDITVTDGKITQDIIVKSGEQNVAEDSVNNLKRYTLTLYAVWEKQNLFEVVVVPNQGRLLQDDGDYYDATQRKMSLLDESVYRTYYSADIDEKEFIISSGYYTTSKSVSSSLLATRTDHVFMGGISYLSDSESVDYAFKQESATSSYRQKISNIKINLEDPSMNITSKPVQAGDGTEVTMYTLTLYPTYKKQQYFKVALDPNGATFKNSSGTVVDNFEFTSSAYDHDIPSGTVSSIEYTGYNDIYSTNPGYILRGFSYTKDGTIDLSITTSSSNRRVTVGNVNVDKNNTEGKTITQSWHEADGARIETTTLTLYAVWGTRLNYSSISGVIDRTEERIKPLADDRVFKIEEFKPTNGNYTFLGWSSTSGGVAEYGAKGYYLELNNMELKDSYTLAADESYKTLYGVWAQKYELRYAANGGDEASVPVNVISYSTASEEAFSVSAMIPTREGYTFLGWADKADDPVRYSATDPTLENYVTLEGNPLGADTQKTIYAVWEADTSAQDEGDEVVTTSYRLTNSNISSDIVADDIPSEDGSNTDTPKPDEPDVPDTPEPDEPEPPKPDVPDTPEPDVLDSPEPQEGGDTE